MDTIFNNLDKIVVSREGNYIWGEAYDFLDHEVYGELNKTFPTDLVLDNTSEAKRGKQGKAYRMHIHDLYRKMKHLPPCWQTFIRLHYDDKNYERFYEWAKPYVLEEYPKLKVNEIGVRRRGRSKETESIFPGENDLAIGFQLVVCTSHPNEDWQFLSNHIDTSKTLFNVLLYFKEENDIFLDGGFELHKFKTKPRFLTETTPDPEQTELMHVVELKGNNVAFFVNNRYSVHAPQSRPSGRPLRKYIAISGHYKTDLFSKVT